MSAPISADRSQELQWDWPRLMRNPLGNDAVYSSQNFLTPTASVSQSTILYGNGLSGVNAYVKFFTFGSSVQIEWFLFLATTFSSLTAGTVNKLGNTTAANQFLIKTTPVIPTGAKGIDAGFCPAGGYVSPAGAVGIVIPGGSNLVLQSSNVAGSVTMCVCWAEFTD